MVPRRAAVAQLVLLMAASAGETQAESVADAIGRAMLQQQKTQQTQWRHRKGPAVSGQQFAGWLRQEARLEHALAAVRSGRVDDSLRSPQQPLIVDAALQAYRGHRGGADMGGSGVPNMGGELRQSGSTAGEILAELALRGAEPCAACVGQAIAYGDIGLLRALLSGSHACTLWQQSGDRHGVGPLQMLSMNAATHPAALARTLLTLRGGDSTVLNDVQRGMGEGQRISAQGCHQNSETCKRLILGMSTTTRDISLADTHAAVSEMSTAALELLLDESKGFDVAQLKLATRRGGWTVFHLAAYGGDQNIITLCAKAAADAGQQAATIAWEALSSRNTLGRTPLHLAAMRFGATIHSTAGSTGNAVVPVVQAIVNATDLLASARYPDKPWRKPPPLADGYVICTG